MKWNTSLSHLGCSLFLLIILNACSSSRGFNRGELRSSLAATPTVNDQDIQAALNRKPQLPKPFKVAVYFTTPKSSHSAPQWRWSEEDKAKILSLKDKLSNPQEMSDFFPIFAEAGSGEDLKSLRLIAAKHGADALLVVSGIADLDEYSNKNAWAYVFLITTLFVPGTDADVLFLSRATLWDVRNEFLYLSAEAETTFKQSKPLFLMNLRDGVEGAKKDSVQRLREEIEKNFRALLNKK